VHAARKRQLCASVLCAALAQQRQTCQQ